MTYCDTLKLKCFKTSQHVIIYVSSGPYGPSYYGIFISFNNFVDINVNHPPAHLNVFNLLIDNVSYSTSIQLYGSILEYTSLLGYCLT